MFSKLKKEGCNELSSLHFFGKFKGFNVKLLMIFWFCKFVRNLFIITLLRRARLLMNAYFKLLILIIGKNPIVCNNIKNKSLVNQGWEPIH